MRAAKDSRKNKLVILDYGCGTDSPVKSIRSQLKEDASRIEWIGADVHHEAIEASKKNGIHDRYLLIDYPDLSNVQDVDVVLLLDVIEHLRMDEGFNLLRTLEKKAKLLIVYTPHGFLYQAETANNRFQKHLSGWRIRDFERLGYEVSGRAGWLFIHQTFLDPEFDAIVWHWGLKRPELLYRALRHLLSWLPPIVLIKNPRWASFLLATKFVT